MGIIFDSCIWVALASKQLDPQAVIAAAGAPIVVSQPVNLAVAPGAPATFNVVATGYPVPTYQWRKGGAVLAGATASTLALPNAQVADAGSYSVVVANSFGSITSGFQNIQQSIRRVRVINDNG